MCVCKVLSNTFRCVCRVWIFQSSCRSNTTYSLCEILVSLPSFVSFFVIKKKKKIVWFSSSQHVVNFFTNFLFGWKVARAQKKMAWNYLPRFFFLVGGRKRTDTTLPTDTSSFYRFAVQILLCVFSLSLLFGPNNKTTTFCYWKKRKKKVRWPVWWPLSSPSSLFLLVFSEHTQNGVGSIVFIKEKQLYPKTPEIS